MINNTFDERLPYNPVDFSYIIIKNYNEGKKVFASFRDWYELAKAYREALEIMEQNNCLAVPSDSKFMSYTLPQ